MNNHKTLMESFQMNFVVIQARLDQSHDDYIFNLLHVKVNVWYLFFWWLSKNKRVKIWHADNNDMAHDDFPSPFGSLVMKRKTNKNWTVVSMSLSLSDLFVPMKWSRLFFRVYSLILCLFVYILCRRDKKKKAATRTKTIHTQNTTNDVDNAISVINATEIIQHREKCVTQRPISGL